MMMPFFKKSKELDSTFISSLQSIRDKIDILSICPTPTGYSWLGVQIASLSLFPDCTFQIPQYYSNQQLTDEQLIQFAKIVNDLDFKQIIFNGFMPYWGKIIDNLKNEIKIKVIYHGFLSELSGNVTQLEAFNSLLVYVKKKRICAIGCVKKGLALSLENLYSIKAFEIILPNNSIADKVPLCSGIDIGVLVNTSFRKNVHNQAVASLMVQNSVLHTFQTNELSYLPQDRIAYYDLLSHNDFLKLLARMSVNLHVTFSEGMGGQVCSESISQGVPCISAYTSSFFDYNEDLKRKLIVEGFDDSWHIYQKIEKVLQNRNSIGYECIEYANLLNILSKERLLKFLN